MAPNIHLSSSTLRDAIATLSSVLVAKLLLSRWTCSVARASVLLGEATFRQVFEEPVSIKGNGFVHGWNPSRPAKRESIEDALDGHVAGRSRRGPVSIGHEGMGVSRTLPL